MAEKTELLPCPFCAAEKISSVIFYGEHHDLHSYKCRSCGCKGSYQDSKHGARVAWNTRPLPTVEQAARVLLEYSAGNMPPKAKAPFVMAYIASGAVPDPNSLHAGWIAALKSLAGGGHE